MILTDRFTGRVLRGFYAVEGVDGCGKTTALAALRKLCADEGVDNMLEFHAEPTSGAMGKACRELLGGGGKHPSCFNAYMFAADRYDHLYRKGTGIRSLIEQGKMVIADRYIYSSIVYQACMEDDGDYDDRLHRKALATVLNGQFEEPEKVFFFDCPSGLARERQEKRGDASPDSIRRLSDLNGEYLRFFRRMEILREWGDADSYEGEPAFRPRVVWLDPRKSPEELAAEMYREIFC